MSHARSRPSVVVPFSALLIRRRHAWAWGAVAIALGACSVERPADPMVEPPLPSPAVEHPAYVEDLAAIFARSCVGCHGVATSISEPRNCVRTDRWDAAADPGRLCSDPVTRGTIFGVGDAGPLIVDNVTTGRMPLGGPPLSAAEMTLFQRWADDGYPKRTVNQPPVIQLLTPPASGATVCQPSCNFAIGYATNDPDGDTIRWSLAWAGGGESGTFAAGLPGGSGSVMIDATSLKSGTYVVSATLDDGTAVVTTAAAGTLTVPANHNAAPTVTVTTPNGGESYDSGAPITISWLGADPDDAMLTYDVSAVGATTIPIGTLTAPVGPSQIVWTTPPKVTAPTAFKIEIAVRDATTRSPAIVDRSDADFAIRPPAAAVSFGQQIQPILTASCTSSACHDASQPAQGLQLTSGAAYTALMAAAAECPADQRVSPGNPDQSYLMLKLQGSGDCFTGSRMPRGNAPLSAAQLQLIRDWITNGAPNN